MRHRIICSAIIILLIFLPGVVLAQMPQKHVRSQEQLWLGYLKQMRFSEKWGAWVDVHYRMTDNLADRNMQFLFRPAVTYFMKDNLRLNAGYALIKHFPAKGFNTTRTEHRAWQHIWWNQKYPGVTMLQYLRFEQRSNQKIIRSNSGWI